MSQQVPEVTRVRASREVIAADGSEEDEEEELLLSGSESGDVRPGPPAGARPRGTQTTNEDLAAAATQAAAVEQAVAQRQQAVGHPPAPKQQQQKKKDGKPQLRPGRQSTEEDGASDVSGPLAGGTGGADVEVRSEASSASTLSEREQP